MSELIRNYAIYLPLVSLVVITIILQKRKNNINKKKSLKSLFIGILIVGLISFFIGMLAGAEYYCIGSQYAECTLGGIFVGGPISFTIFTIIYLLYWANNEKKS